MLTIRTAVLASALLGVVAPSSRPAGTSPTTPVKIADGVYVFIHPNATEDWPNGNTTLIVGDSAALVIDSGYLPSVARDDIATIRSLTRVPVRFLLNTHWHYDHNNGNAEYKRAFPGLQIVAHSETKRIMDVMGPGYFRSVTDSASPSNRILRDLKQQLASGKTAGGAPLAAQAREALAANIAGRENEQREFATAVYMSPTLTFDRSLDLDLGGRVVTIANLGRGNTPGDAFAWLEKEHILASGDLLVAPVQYPFNSYPAQWIKVLKGLEGLNAQTIVPGHGPIMHDYAYLHDVLAVLQSAVSQAEQVARRRIPEDAAVKQIDLEPFRTRFTHGDTALDAQFDALVGALPLRALREARGIN